MYIAVQFEVIFNNNKKLGNVLLETQDQDTIAVERFPMQCIALTENQPYETALAS